MTVELQGPWRKPRRRRLRNLRKKTHKILLILFIVLCLIYSIPPSVWQTRYSNALHLLTAIPLSLGGPPSTSTYQKVAAGRATIGKVSMLYGDLGPTYERALRLHDKHNENFGYPVFLLREHIISNLWSKPAFAASILTQELAKPKDQRLKWLCWFDGDIVLMNPNIPLEIFLPPEPELAYINVLVTRDWHGLNNGVYFFKVNEWSLELMSAVTPFTHFRPDVKLKYGDQSALAILIEEEPFNRSVACVPQHWFNAYPPFAYTAVDANDTFQPWEHQGGELLMHFAGQKKSLERMEYWIDVAEQHLPEWEVPLAETWYEEDIKAFWDGFYKDSGEGYRSEGRGIHDV